MRSVLLIDPNVDEVPPPSTLPAKPVVADHTGAVDGPANPQVEKVTAPFTVWVVPASVTVPSTVPVAVQLAVSWPCSTLAFPLPSVVTTLSTPWPRL
jgi:hypothetical protein